MNNFTRGLITGAVIGATMGMALKENKNFRMSRRTMKNGRRFVRTASNLLENIFDI